VSERETGLSADAIELPARNQLELEWRIQHMQHLEGLKVLSGGIANDLNNLLMTIGGNTDLVMQNLPVQSAETLCRDL